MLTETWLRLRKKDLQGACFVPPEFFQDGPGLPDFAHRTFRIPNHFQQDGSCPRTVLQGGLPARNHTVQHVFCSWQEVEVQKNPPALGSAFSTAIAASLGFACAAVNEETGGMVKKTIIASCCWSFMIMSDGWSLHMKSNPRSCLDDLEPRPVIQPMKSKGSAKHPDTCKAGQGWCAGERPNLASTIIAIIAATWSMNKIHKADNYSHHSIIALVSVELLLHFCFD